MRSCDRSKTRSPALRISRTFNTTVQQGQASITATFNLSSNKTTDLVQVQRRVMIAQSQLPSDMPAPTVGTFDPAQATVLTIGLSSNAVSPGAAVGNRDQQHRARARASRRRFKRQRQRRSHARIRSAVNPNLLTSAGYTLSDVVSSIQNNNNREPGGIAYLPGHETTIDVRGDLTTEFFGSESADLGGLLVHDLVR